MATGSIHHHNAEFVSTPTSLDAEVKWYAVYTSARCEKKVAAEMLRREVDSLLPLYHSVRRWSDRRVKLLLPLFPGYVFVHLALRDRLKVLQIPGVAKLVGFGGSPIALPAEQMDALRKGLDKGCKAQPHPYLQEGRMVRVVHGPLSGAIGILVRKKSIHRIVLSLDLIMRSMSVEIDAADIQPVH
jgi:transcription antitermination factor NusG